MSILRACMALYFFRRPMLYDTWQCSVRAIQLEHLKLDLDSTYVAPCLRHSVHLLVVVSVTERVGGNSL